MSSNLKLQLTLTAKDVSASNVLKQMEQNIKRTATVAVQESEKAGRAQESVVRKIEREQKQAAAARARLGIRSEQDIQREILRTERAYQALARSSKTSQNELQRAAKASRQRIRELNEELGKSSKLQKAFSLGGAVMAGAAGAGAVLKPAMNDEKQFQANLTQVTWQAFGEDNNKSADWLAKDGKKQIKDLIYQLIDKNGGNTNAALGLVNGMLANGMDFENVKKNADSSYKYMISSAERVGEYNPSDAAKLIKVLSDFGFSGKDLDTALDHTTKSGMQGNFEIADMVRELPALLPVAKSSGLNGMQGLDYLLSMLQSSANKAGSNSEAANNVRNTLEKTLSADTTTRLKKMLNPNDKKKGIDWQGSVLAGAEHGENAVQVLARLADTMLARDAKYQAFKAKAEKGDDNAKQQMNIMKGFVLSSLLPDIQAKAGLNAAVDTEQMQDYIKGLNGIKSGDEGLGNKKHDFMSRDDAFIQEKNQSLTMLQRSDSVDKLNSWETKWTALTAQFPNATLALSALATAATAASVPLGLMALAKGGSAGGIVSGAIGAGGKLLGRLAPVAAAGIGIYNAYEIAHDDKLTSAQKHDAQIKNAGIAAGGIGGAFAGGAAGAAIGSVVPIIGTAIGGAVGAILGGFGGSWGGEKLAGLMTSSKKQYPQTAVAATNAMNENNKSTSWHDALNDKRLNQIPPLLAKQTTDYQSAIQANNTAIGTRLDKINNTLSGQNQTISTTIQVQLDGRVIGEQVARQQIAMYNRGGAQ